MDKENEEKTQLAFWGDEELRMRVDRVARKMADHFDGASISRAFVLKRCVELKLPELEEMYR
jgi:hypothetical protein